MTDAYYPEFDPGIMTSTPAPRAADAVATASRELTADQSFAYRAACARQGIAFTDRDGNHVLDGTRGNGVHHDCAGHWTLAGQNSAGHDVYTCGAASHRYVAMHRSALHKCLTVLDCASGTVTEPARLGGRGKRPRGQAVMNDVQRYARVPAEMSRAGWSRNAEHVATAGQVTGRGASQAGALDDLGSNLAAMAARVRRAPVFWWDADNSQLWVAVTDPVTGDWTSSIVCFTDGAPYVSVCTSSGAGPAEEAYASAIGMERVTSHGTRSAPRP